MFWSGWIKFLVVLNLGITFFLFIYAVRVKIPKHSDGTTGHVWAHGVLREGVRKLPMWWIVLSASMFVWGITYLVLYPGFGSNEGVLGWTQEGKLEREMGANLERLEATYEGFRNVPLEQLALDGDAQRIGERLFIDNCAACHGRQGQGNPGYPRLNDHVWNWGGSPDEILTSIRDGRNGIMAPLGAALGEQGTIEAAHYVASLSGIDHDAQLAEAGQDQYGKICVACHGVDATGNKMLGAPDLTAGAFMHGKDVDAIIATITHGRTGEMPAWKARLDDDEIRLVASWVIGNVDTPQSATGSP